MASSCTVFACIGFSCFVLHVTPFIIDFSHQKKTDDGKKTGLCLEISGESGEKINVIRLPNLNRVSVGSLPAFAVCEWAVWHSVNQQMLLVNNLQNSEFVYSVLLVFIF